MNCSKIIGIVCFSSFVRFGVSILSSLCVGLCVSVTVMVNDLIVWRVGIWGGGLSGVSGRF